MDPHPLALTGIVEWCHWDAFSHKARNMIGA